MNLWPAGSPPWWDNPRMDDVRELVISPCQARCAWSTSDDRLGGDLLFACSACGSEWVASEAWTPVDWQGVVPEAVQAERARRT
jgi:hypothetical protein